MASSDPKITILVKWVDTDNCGQRLFHLSYYLANSTIEMYDIIYKKKFLKRTEYEGITLSDFFIGNKFVIFSRSLIVLDYVDDYTKRTMSTCLQKTFALIKPDGIKSKGKILKMILENGFRIGNLTMVQMRKEQAEELYIADQGQSYFPMLLEHVISGPVIAMELYADNAVDCLINLVGPADIDEARKDFPHSIRACLGIDRIKNTIHCSKTLELVHKESAMFFTCEDRPRPVSLLEGTTFCVVKPHIVKQGKLGDIIISIEENKFQVTGMKMFYLSVEQAEEYLEIYKGVLPEYKNILSELISGGCVALEIAGEETSEQTQEAFRKFVGPHDPELARQLYKNTLRAQYGKNKVENAVVCTELPTDTQIDLEYFFKILE